VTNKRLNPLWQLTSWRVKEFMREPEAVFWVFAFPILLAFALGIAFKSRGTEVVKVGIPDGPAAQEMQAAFTAADGTIEALVLDSAEAFNQLRTGRVSVLAVPGDPVVLRFDSTRQESYLARLVVEDALQEAAGRRDVREIREQRVTEPGARYIDFLIPGLLGMNIMGTGLWGIGFGVVKARQQHLLRRFLASPMRKSDYMLSHMLARLVFLVFEVSSVVLFAWLVFDVPVRGSLATISLVVLFGAASFAGLGLLVASRARTIEGVSGLMNLVMVPMWIGSGVFFSYGRFPEALQPFLKALPLTALNDALRAVMIDGSGFAAITGMLGVIAAWGLASFAIALRVFRWS
jgi:ABC-type multidrug transport system permease subunit